MIPSGEIGKQISAMEDYLQSDNFLKDYLDHAQNTILDNYFKRYPLTEDKGWNGALNQENHNFANFKERVIRLFRKIESSTKSVQNLTLLLPYSYDISLEKELEGFTPFALKAGEVISEALISGGTSLIKEGARVLQGKKEKPLSIHITLRDFLKSKGFTIKFHSLKDQEISFLINEDDHYNLPFPVINEIILHFSRKSNGHLPISLFYVWSGLDLSDHLKNFIPLRNLITIKD
jgi:hypothetical protein